MATKRWESLHPDELSASYWLQRKLQPVLLSVINLHRTTEIENALSELERIKHTVFTCN